MKKLRLDLDELVVASFQTSLPERDGGTVQGYDFSAWSDGSVCPGATTTRTGPHTDVADT
jgi:hypothetical protein